MEVFIRIDVNGAECVTLQVTFLSSLILAMCSFMLLLLSIGNISLIARVLYIIRRLQRHINVSTALLNHTITYSEPVLGMGERGPWLSLIHI